MVTKILGYLLSIVGVLAIAYTSVQQLQKLITLPENFPTLYITIAGAVIVILGLALVLKSRKPRQNAELPIYQGKQIIGYRRD